MLHFKGNATCESMFNNFNIHVSIVSIFASTYFSYQKLLKTPADLALAPMTNIALIPCRAGAMSRCSENHEIL